MSSFYGGRPGQPFIIVATFNSVNAMITQFKKGPNYTTVHYDEHVVIATTDNNDDTNGNVYRRGYNYTNSMGGAELIGNIFSSMAMSSKAELVNIRVGYDNTLYDSAGNAVRAQIADLQNSLSAVSTLVDTLAAQSSDISLEDIQTAVTDYLEEQHGVIFNTSAEITEVLYG